MPTAVDLHEGVLGLRLQCQISVIYNGKHCIDYSYVQTPECNLKAQDKHLRHVGPCCSKKVKSVLTVVVCKLGDLGLLDKAV